jgi:hypothetical protein
MTKARWGGKIETERIIKRGDFELDVPMLAAPLPDEYARSGGLPCRDSRSAKVDAMRVRLNTLLGLMGAVACIAVALAGYVAYESDTGSPTVGLAIVVASTAAVAAIITAASNSQRRADAQTVPVVRLLMTILKSCGLAVLIVGLADSAFVLTYALIVGGRQFFPFSAEVRARQILPEGLIAGTVVAVAVCYLARRGFSRSTPIRRRLLCRLASLAAVVLLLGSNVMSQRFHYREQQASWHDSWVGDYGGVTRNPMAPPPVGLSPCPELADYHARMRRKWEYGALHPWLPVEPDPPPPEPGRNRDVLE